MDYQLICLRLWWCVLYDSHSYLPLHHIPAYTIFRRPFAMKSRYIHPSHRVCVLYVCVLVPACLLSVSLVYVSLDSPLLPKVTETVNLCISIIQYRSVSIPLISERERHPAAASKRPCCCSALSTWHPLATVGPATGRPTPQCDTSRTYSIYNAMYGRQHAGYRPVLVLGLGEFGTPSG